MAIISARDGDKSHSLGLSLLAALVKRKLLSQIRDYGVLVEVVRGASVVEQYVDLKRLLDAVHKYRTEGVLPHDVEEIDLVCARVLTNDPFDETAIDWKRIAEYEKEINGGTWPRND